MLVALKKATNIFNGDKQGADSIDRSSKLQRTFFNHVGLEKLMPTFNNKLALWCHFQVSLRSNLACLNSFLTIENKG